MPHFKVICLNAEGLFKLEVHTFELPCAGSLFVRDRGTTLRLGGGVPLVIQYGGGAQDTFSY